jgi:hypothetical protein
MSLLSSADEQIFESLKNLMLRVNEHAVSKDYAVILLRTKKFKLEVKRKVWIICDRDERLRESRKEERRHITSRCIECLFSLTAKRMNDSDDNSWVLEVINDQHNHSFTFVDSHSVQRKIAMTSEIRNDIARQLRVQATFSQIISSLRISNSIDDSFVDSKNSEIINSLIKSRDIYNLKTKFRRDSLEPLTFVQALIRELDRGNWTYAMQKNDENHITHLFFVKGTSEILLKTNYEILIMNCTYKTNRYKLSLLIISEQTAMHINFYVVFCFMQREIIADYIWVLQQLRALYVKLKLSDSTMIVTNMKRDLITFIDFIFVDVNHLLCLWHINNNVVINCKRHFNTKEEWDVFFSDWKSVSMKEETRFFDWLIENRWFMPRQRMNLMRSEEVFSSSMSRMITVWSI